MVFSTLLEYAAVSYLGNRKWKPRPALIVAKPPLQSSDYTPLPAANDAAGAGFLGQTSPILPVAGTGQKFYRKYESDGSAASRERVNPSFRFSGEAFDNVAKAQNAVQVRASNELRNRVHSTSVQSNLVKGRIADLSPFAAANGFVRYWPHLIMVP